MKKVSIKLLNSTAKIPTRGSLYAAGYDLYASGEHIIDAGSTLKVSTGIAIQIPYGYFGAIFARSGLSVNEGLRPANCVGVIDCDYTGEVIVALHNDSRHHRRVHDGDRIAQLVIIPYQAVEFEQVDDLKETERGDGGFGSTGT